MALTRQLGRPIVAVTNLGPIRDIIERSYGGHAHELLAEARALANQDRTRATADPGRAA
jgi:hypothetical protein